MVDTAELSNTQPILNRCGDTHTEFAVREQWLCWQAVRGADVVYTDSWFSYGIPDSDKERRIADLM